MSKKKLAAAIAAGLLIVTGVTLKGTSDGSYPSAEYQTSFSEVDLWNKFCSEAHTSDGYTSIRLINNGNGSLLVSRKGDKYIVNLNPNLGVAVDLFDSPNGVETSYYKISKTQELELTPEQVSQLYFYFKLNSGNIDKDPLEMGEGDSQFYVMPVNPEGFKTQFTLDKFVEDGQIKTNTGFGEVPNNKHPM